jgi:hypothetical protein
MATVFVAKSQGLAKWGNDVGLSKHVYKIGVTDEKAEDAIGALNEAQCAGQNDWRLLRKQDAGDADEATVLARMAQKEKAVDPKYYPRLRGDQGIFKVKLGNVENSLLMKQALAGKEFTVIRPKPADIAAYLLEIASGWAWSAENEKDESSASVFKD